MANRLTFDFSVLTLKPDKKRSGRRGMAKLLMSVTRPLKGLSYGKAERVENSC